MEKKKERSSSVLKNIMTLITTFLKCIIQSKKISNFASHRIR